MKIRGLLITIVVLILAISLAGCYWNEELEPNESAAQLDAGRITGCVGPGGVYTDLSWWSDIKKISNATFTFSVEDPEVATSNNQLVGVKITIQAKRNTSCDGIKNLLSNWPHLLDDTQVVSVVTATAREGIKVGTRNFTMDQLLNDRNGLAIAIGQHIEADAEKYSVDIVNVTIENVALDPEYAKTLQDQALFTAQTDKELKRQQLVRQKAETDKIEQEQLASVLLAQLEKEKAQTDVNVEIASRKGKEVAAANEVYLQNTPAYELEKLRLMQAIFGEKATMWFIERGTDLTLLLNGGVPNAIPVEVGQ